MKRKTKTIIILFLIILGFSLLLFIRSKVVPQPVSTPSPSGISYKSLIPGVTTKKEAIDKLGNPLNDPEESVLNYKSTNPNLNHALEIENDRVVFIKEIVSPKDNIEKEDLIQEYGNPPEMYYGPYSVNGFNLYVYPDQGVAFLGHVSGSGVLEIWYFPPTSAQNFLERWGEGYSTEHRPIQ